MFRTTDFVQRSYNCPSDWSGWSNCLKNNPVVRIAQKLRAVRVVRTSQELRAVRVVRTASCKSCTNSCTSSDLCDRNECWTVELMEGMSQWNLYELVADKLSSCTNSIATTNSRWLSLTRSCTWLYESLWGCILGIWASRARDCTENSETTPPSVV